MKARDSLNMNHRIENIRTGVLTIIRVQKNISDEEQMTLKDLRVGVKTDHGERIPKNRTDILAKDVSPGIGVKAGEGRESSKELSAPDDQE